MFIQTEMTPNPETLKFIPGEDVMGEGTANFTTAEDAVKSPLAASLFATEVVTGVFLGSDFITVTKEPDANWNTIKSSVLGAIMEHYLSDVPVIELDEAAFEPNDEDDDPIVAQIKELLDMKVRPMVAQDGGDIIFHGYEDGVVFLHMQGACAGCPSSTATLKYGIENLLRHYIPEVVEVRAI